MRGYAGKILEINLSNGYYNRDWLVETWAENYLGARGLGERYLFHSIPYDADPLSPENALVLMTGPTAGTLISSASRLSVVTKSPATHTILECSIGGNVGPQVKYAGFDGIVIKGKAAQPSYLYIKDNRVEIRDASFLWGKGTHETEFRLKEMLGERVSCLAIGPAGENMLPISCITSDFYRQAGRGGVGAVLGSKNLKAIVIHGTRGLRIKEMPKFLDLAKELLVNEVLSGGHDWVRDEGTPLLVQMSNDAGLLPTRNFTQGRIADVKNLNSASVQVHKKYRHACMGCALGCGNFVQTDLGFVEGPEYETIALIGSNCGMEDMAAVVQFNKQCDDLGIDTMSAGNIVAYAMELTERGIYDFKLHFGEMAEYLKVPSQIAYQTGRGQDLGRGVKYLAQKYGCPEAALEIKGLEFPGYDPRGSWGMALAYATSYRGACHLRAWPVGREGYANLAPCTIEGKARMVIDDQHAKSVKYSTGACDFWGASYQTLARLLTFFLEREVSPEELVVTGERIYNLSRIFNVLNGFTRADDRIPERMHQNLANSKYEQNAISKEAFEKMLDEYYALRGWDQDGIPTMERLISIGMDGQIMEMLKEVGDKKALL